MLVLIYFSLFIYTFHVQISSSPLLVVLWRSLDPVFSLNSSLSTIQPFSFISILFISSLPPQMLELHQGWFPVLLTTWATLSIMSQWSLIAEDFTHVIHYVHDTESTVCVTSN